VQPLGNVYDSLANSLRKNLSDVTEVETLTLADLFALRGARRDVVLSATETERRRNFL
jgi:hypothetical protein